MEKCCFFREGMDAAKRERKEEKNEKDWERWLEIQAGAWYDGEKKAKQ